MTSAKLATDLVSLIASDAQVIHAVVQVDLCPVHIRAQTLANFQQRWDTAMALQISKQFTSLVRFASWRQAFVIHAQVKAQRAQFALAIVVDEELAQLG
ncbi:MAG: hypothetical protein JW850_18540 [Thermoflexales bacterium]|nr:hypothetical protein [Thermoflexales bacterium]